MATPLPRPGPSAADAPPRAPGVWRRVGENGRARTVVASIFFLNGASVASWVVRIPDVQQALALTPGALGVALLGAAAGAVVAMPVAGRLVTRFGSRPVAIGTALAYAATLPLAPVATSFAWLVAALLVNGAFNGSLNVSMNAHASLISRRMARPILSSFHALFSGGGLVGAAAGGAIAAAGVSATAHLTLVAVVMLLTTVATGRWLLPSGHDARAPEAGGRGVPHRPNGRVAILGLLAFVVLFAEGAMGDWSAVYLRDVAGAGPGMVASGYGAFSVMMALGRVVGDRLTEWLGANRVVGLGGALATVGVALALLVPGTLPAAIGFGAVGAGLATAFPSVLAAASRVPGTSPGDGIAAVVTLGYFGLLAGPPIIGFVAQATTLSGGMSAVGCACLLTAILAKALREPGEDAAGTALPTGAIAESSLH